MHLSLIEFTVIIAALAFEFINGFHDTANAVATSVSTRSLEPFQAICIAAVFNLLGALSGTAVATTIAKGFVEPTLVTQSIVLVAIISAISWNLFTWYFGIPSSSSHALIGGLIGSVITNYNYKVVKFATVINKVAIPMVLSPIAGFIIALIISVLIHKLFMLLFLNTKKTNSYIREIQVLSTGLLSFSHGANDAQKTMGIITLILFNAHILAKCEVPTWVTIVCAICMASGTLCGGMRIIKTLSAKVAKLNPVNGLASELTSGSILLIASRFGIPLSTTQAIGGSIVGAGSVTNIGVDSSIVRSMLISWILTLPATAFIAAMLSLGLKLIAK